MKILLVSVGTRGDMEPFLALGQKLLGAGHEISCAFPGQFRELTISSGLNFESLGNKFIELLDSEAGRNAMGGATGFKKIAGTFKLAMNQNEANRELIERQFEITQNFQPDRILYNGKAVYPMIWELSHPGKTFFISPLPYMHYVKGHTHVAFNANYGSLLNKASFSLAHFGLLTTIRISNKWLKLPDKIKRKEMMEIIRFNKSIYTISPSLFKRPFEWHNNLQVLGFHQRQSTTIQGLDAELEKFLDQHPKTLFITFGSMINSNPQKKTKILLDVLQENQIPCIINTAAGGLTEPENYDRSLIRFVKDVPYSLLFQKVYAVIHHGGAGTTHLGIKYQCPTMIIPHIIDQFVWNKIVSELGLGPKGPKINRLSSKTIGPRILDLMNNHSYKQKALETGQAMLKEEFEEELIDMLTRDVEDSI